MTRAVSAVLLALSIFAQFAFSAPRAAARESGAQSHAPSDSADRAAARLPRVEETGVRFGAGELREPVGVAADAFGFVYVADAMAGKVFRFDAAGASLEFARPPEQAGFYPIDVVVQESFVFVLDYAGNRLLRYSADGAYLDVFISFGVLGSRPVSVAAGAGGRLITTDPVADQVSLWTPLLDIELSIGGFGSAAGRFSDPRKAVFLPDQKIVVVESGNRRLQLFSPSGRYERTAASREETPFVSPRYVAADGRGALFVCDPEGGRLSLFSADLDHAADIDSFGGEPVSPSAAAADWEGKLYVADLRSRSVIVYRLIYPDDK